MLFEITQLSKGTENLLYNIQDASRSLTKQGHQLGGTKVVIR